MPLLFAEVPFAPFVFFVMFAFLVGGIIASLLKASKHDAAAAAAAAPRCETGFQSAPNPPLGAVSMDHYLLPLTAEQIDLLRGGDVSFMPYSVDGVSGALVREDQLDASLDALRQDVASCRSSHSPGIFIVTLQDSGGGTVPAAEEIQMLLRERAALEQRRQELEGELIQTLQEIHAFDEKIAGFNAGPPAPASAPEPAPVRPRGEFDELLEIPHVVGVEGSLEALCIFTDEIQCRDPQSGILYELGRFRIEFSFGQERDNLRFFNLTRVTEVEWAGETRGFHAPHVQSDGTPCLGNYKDTLFALIAQRNVNAAVVGAIEWLQSVNSDDAWGKNIDSWPRISA